MVAVILGEGALGPFENLLGGHRPFPREPHTGLHIPALGQGLQGGGGGVVDLVLTFSQAVTVATAVAASAVPGTGLGPL